MKDFVYNVSVVDSIREKAGIVSIIGEHVELSPIGNGYIGKCPFHEDEGQMLFVNPELNLYSCLDTECGAQGDAIDFLMRISGILLNEAVEKAAEKSGISLEGMKVRTDTEKRAQTVRDINAEAALVYVHEMMEPQCEAYAYFAGRGLDRKTMAKFGVGHAPKGAAAYEAVKSKGYSDEAMKDSGLFSFRDDREPRDMFSGRAVFPVFDGNGEVVGFGGRRMDDSNRKSPKYINSRESVAFDKSRMLYGMHIAQNTKRDAIILCEGFMDVIAMHQAGFDSAVASLGTSLTKPQADIIAETAGKAVIAYDSDDAGQKATGKAIRMLRKAGVAPYVADLSPFKDPDELIRAEGGKEMAKRIEEAVPADEFEIRIIISRCETLKEADRAFCEMIEPLTEKRADECIEIYARLRKKTKKKRST